MDDPLAPLLEGYARFRAGVWVGQRKRWAELAEGQSPRTMVIACSDSRVDPAQIFDTSPGEIFVVRNVANLVPPFETSPGHHGVSAALEFAVTQLDVAQVVVLGHGGCGGCRAALEGEFAEAAPGDGGFIADWLGLLSDARGRVRTAGGGTQAMEQEAVRVSLANLRSFRFVAEREAAGTLALAGAWFAIADGALYLLDEASGAFSPASGEGE